MLKEQLTVITESVGVLLPEISLLAMLLLLVVADLVIVKNKLAVLSFLFVVGLIGSGLVLYNMPMEEGQHLFLKALYVDGTMHFYKFLLLLSGVILLGFRWLGNDKIAQAPSERGLALSGDGEFFVLVTAVLLGGHFLLMSNNLLMLFLSIELISLPSYLLVLFRFNKQAAEAGTKYLLYGAVASGITIYGISWLYGLSGGNIHFEGLAAGMMEADGMYYMGLFFLLGGILFKLSAVPFHIWAPDVYQGGPTSVVAFVSVVPKVVTLAVLARMLEMSRLLTYEGVQETILGIALLSILWGTLSAVWQKSSKRMMAYSTIAHIGFMLIVTTINGDLAWQALRFYMAIYMLGSFAAFFFIDLVEEARGTDHFKSFEGVGRNITYIGALMVMVMVSLTGLPPTAGFTAKFFVFSSLWQDYQVDSSPLKVALLLVGLLSTAIALYFYIKIPYHMYFRKGEVEATTIQWSLGRKLFFALLSLPLLLIFFIPSLLVF
ncbi:NADH-quinone oxidoreductase subunit N [Algivirga pacifica]|uniref:NADH-quinone oxidoreductase subunit N n=1 Tax=Algivirga pacifica TaxID=1162670 RepID=A0ABP9D5C4_9BACT